MGSVDLLGLADILSALGDILGGFGVLSSLSAA